MQPFTHTLHSMDDYNAFTEALIDYETAHISADPAANMAYIPAYYNVKVCLEEFVTNAFKHGYAEVERKPQVEVVLQPHGGTLTAQITDNAAVFNPLADLPEKDAAGWEAQLVLGVELARKLVEDIRYTPLPDGNKLILRQAAD